MFDIEDFEDYPLLIPKIIRINKLIDKDKTSKISKIIEELENLLEDQDLLLQITYILSVIAEYDIDFITERLIKKIEKFLLSDDDKLKINSIIIIGFFITSNPNFIESFYEAFINFIVDNSNDVRDNAHYFLQEFIKKEPKSICKYRNIILQALEIEEKNKENISSLLNFLNQCDSLNFNQLIKFRELSKRLISYFYEGEKSQIKQNLRIILNKFFPSLKDLNLENLRTIELKKLLDDQFIMKKEAFTDIKNREKNITLKNYIEKLKNSRLKEIELNFYINDKKNNDTYFYQLEKDKVVNFFDRNKKIPLNDLKIHFSEIINSDYELKSFTKMLVRLGIIEGYLSEFYFYPYNYLYTEIMNSFQKRGFVNLKGKFDILPPKYLHDIILGTNQEILMGRNNDIYFSLKKIKEEIIETAAKDAIINLKPYREKLREDHFIKLIKNLPKEYLTNFRKGTVFLTNIGKNRVETEINNSKFVGFMDLNKLSEKLKIYKILLMDVILLNIDDRSGIWDKNKEIFYYSKYITDRIEKINLISDEKEKENQISFISKELNIDRNHILTKIDENFKLIGEEIKNKDEINISEYTEKTGLTYELFFSFINELGLNYFIKGDQLILNPKKIEEAKNSIRYNLIDSSKSANHISLGNFEINSDLIRELIIELKKDGKLKGIFYMENEELLFFTEKGIRELMLENSSLFSFEDLFYEKELSQEETDLLTEIFNDLVKEKKLVGNFNQETLTFSSKDVIFASDYNSSLFELEKNVNSYLQKFNLEFQKIKKILTKQNETIFPQEIKMIQDTIDRINGKYVMWRDSLEAFILRANATFLKKQGLTVKRYKTLKQETLSELKEDIKSFEDDLEVSGLMIEFNNWVKLFNELELKYPNVIFYQKRLIANPEDKESNKKFNDLLIILNLKS
jgi:hypothetical protein